jgi:SAM-dependent methyltransferase
MVVADSNESAKAEKKWSRGKLRNVDSCPACGCQERLPEVYRRKDDSVSMPDIWNMVRCKDCASLYLDPRPDDESLPRAYDEYFTHNRNAETYSTKGVSGLLWRLVNGYLNNRFGMSRAPSTKIGYFVFMMALPWRLKLDYFCRQLFAVDFPNRGSLLDLGCGNGNFLERAVGMGWDALGCEPDADAVKVCRAAGLDVIHGDVFSEALDESGFDVITVSHVIEHVPDMDRALTRIHSILRPGGVAWFAMPNPNSITIKLFKSAAFNLHFPCHLLLPTQEQFVNKLSDVGFTEVRTVRRGVQARSHWDDSVKVADLQDLPRPGRVSILMSKLLSDILCVFSVKWGEELIFLARKK